MQNPVEVSAEVQSLVNALTILGWSALLQRNPGREAIAEAASAIAHSATVQAKLIDDLLDVSRIMTGKFAITAVPLDLRTAHGTIETRLTRDGSFAVIEVSDTGEGISADFLPYVFDRCSQATNRRFAGLGLGLAIVKHIVELHGGSVVAASDGPGKGATFTVRIPCAAPSRTQSSTSHVDTVTSRKETS